MIYHYYDGSGNHYKIEKQIIEYIPVKPIESSSGNYSGGEPFKRSLTTEELKSIIDLMEKVFKLPQEQSNKRTMMTEMFTIQKNKEKKTCILLANSEIKKNIELTLQQFKEK